MKKSLAVLAGVGLAFLGAPTISHAQAASGPFADVPTDHWAYSSVDTLQKAGIVIGYPDGTYGGRRPMTRYEFAVAIARLLGKINPTVDTSGFAKTSDLDALRTDIENRLTANQAALDALKTLVNGFQGELTRLGQDVAAINRRLDALEARVNGIDSRVRVLEDANRHLKITGVLNVIGEANAPRHRDVNGFYTPFANQNGVLQNTPNASDNRLLAATDVYTDFLLGIRGDLGGNASANVKLDYGNYLNALRNISRVGSAQPTGLLTGNQSFNSHLREAYVDAPVGLGPLGGAELQVGRLPNQFTKWTLKQPDADVYTNLYQTDSGNFEMDGAKVALKAGPAAIQAYAAKLDSIPFQSLFGGSGFTTPTGSPVANGNQFGRRPLGQVEGTSLLRQGAGIRATFGAPEGAVFGLTAEEFALGDNLKGPQTVPVLDVNGNPTGATSVVNGYSLDNPIDPDRNNGQRYNRLSVYGADFNGALPFAIPGIKKGGLLLDTAYTVSAHGGQNSFNDVGNGFRHHAYDAQLGFAVGPVQLKGGYQYIGPEFTAPGYWGRLGAWTNPTNVRGPVISAKYAFTPKLTLNADAQFYSAVYGTQQNGNLIDSPLIGKVNYPVNTATGVQIRNGGADHVNRYQVGLGYGLSSSSGVDLGYENVQYDLRNQTQNLIGGNQGTLISSGKPTESYFTLGIGHSINPNASFKLLYQIVHYDDAGTGFGGSQFNNNGTVANGKSDGSVAVGQFQLKF